MSWEDVTGKEDLNNQNCLTVPLSSARDSFHSFSSYHGPGPQLSMLYSELKKNSKERLDENMDILIS